MLIYGTTTRKQNVLPRVRWCTRVRRLRVPGSSRHHVAAVAALLHKTVRLHTLGSRSATLRSHLHRAPDTSPRHPTRAVAVAAAHLLADSERRRRRARACRALTRRGARAALTPPLNARASRHGARSTPAAGVAQLCDPYLTVAYEPYVQ